MRVLEINTSASQEEIMKIGSRAVHESLGRDVTFEGRTGASFASLPSRALQDRNFRSALTSNDQTSVS
jgi:hypothetical protein